MSLFRKVLKEGPGLPVVFLHGFLGTADDWEAVCSFLPPCSCIGFDLPGHGQSPFVEKWEIPLSRFHLVGYSMGGRLALQYAHKHPEKVASLTLMSTHPGLRSKEEKEKRLASDAEWGKLLFELPIDEFLKRWYDQPLFKGFKPSMALRRKQNLSDLAAALQHYSLGKQERYEVDHVLVGERDEKFRALFKYPILIPQASHAVHLENPKAVAQLIQQRIF